MAHISSPGFSTYYTQPVTIQFPAWSLRLLKEVITDALSLLFSFCHLEKPKLKLSGQGQVILLGLNCSYFVVFSRSYDKLWMLCGATAFLLMPQLHNHIVSHVVFCGDGRGDLCYIAMTISFVYQAGRTHWERHRQEDEELRPCLNKYSTTKPKCSRGIVWFPVVSNGNNGSTETGKGNGWNSSLIDGSEPPRDGHTTNWR